MDHDFLAWMAIGLVAALVVRRLARGRDPGGPVVAALLGIAGALLGGFAGQAALLYRPGAPAGFAAAAAGAVALVLFHRLVIRRRS